MRRVSAIDSSVRNLGAAHNRIMAQLFEMEGQFDEAAGMLQGVQQINEAPQQPRDRRNLGYNAFAGQGHRIRSPTPTPGEGDGRGTGRPVRPGGGGDLSDRALPNVPDRVDPSRADRHPIHPVRERSDSRSRRVRGLPDRSHSPTEGTFLFPPIGMRVGIGARGLLPSPIGDLRSGIDNRGGRGRSAIAGASLRILIGRSAIAGTSLRTQVVIQEVAGTIGSMPTSRALVMSGGLLGVEPVSTFRVLELLRIVDRPQCRLQEGLPAVMAQTRQRFVPSMILTTVGARMLNSRV